MFDALKQKVSSLLTKDGKPAKDVSYSPVPMTVALRKRKREEEEFTRYGVKKEREFLLDVIE